MDNVTDKIKAGSAAQLKQRRIVARSLDPDDIDRQLSRTDLNDVDHVQLLSPAVDNAKIDNISKWRNQLPIDLYLSDPKFEFPLLYNFSKLGDRHPIRVTIRVKPGFIKAVKLASALNFAVRLDVDQPDTETAREMAEALEFYLHGSTVSQPVEFFHSVFLSFYRNEPADLWLIQEDDPGKFRFVAGGGNEMLWGVKVLDRDECSECEFRELCRGYFKRLLSDYDCKGMTSILRSLKTAAAELRENVAASPAASGSPPR